MIFSSAPILKFSDPWGRVRDTVDGSPSTATGSKQGHYDRKRTYGRAEPLSHLPSPSVGLTTP